MRGAEYMEESSRRIEHRVRWSTCGRCAELSQGVETMKRGSGTRQTDVSTGWTRDEKVEW